MNIINWIIGLVIALLGGFVGIQKHKTNKAIKEKDEALESLDKEKTKVKIEKTTNKVKDELIDIKVENTNKKTAKIKEVADVKQEGKLDEEIESLAALQSARAAARIKQLQNRRKREIGRASCRERV